MANRSKVNSVNVKNATTNRSLTIPTPTTQSIKTRSRQSLSSAEKLNRIKSITNLIDLENPMAVKSKNSFVTTKLDSSIYEAPQIQQQLEEEYQKRINALAFPLDMIRRGLSELGPSPNGFGIVYRKLSIPVNHCHHFIEIEKLDD